MTARDPLQLAGQPFAEKYQIETLVGEGGFAVVYRAVHTIWKQPVAVKFFNGLSSAPVEQRDQLVDGFIQEGKLLTELSSQTAGIVQARDVGSCVTPTGQWMPYMVLEWLDGVGLDEVILRERTAERAPWTVEQVLGFLKRVLPVLEVAHVAGVAHRDIKPANIFVLGEDARSADTKIKLLDFGVAKMVSDNTHLKAALAKTGVGITSFTPQYGAPEQFSRTHGATGPWTDVYAIALVAMELLTGAEALKGDDLVQLGFATSDPTRRPTPRALGISVTDAVERLFAKALAVECSQRFANAREFLAALVATESGSPVTLTGSVRTLTPDSAAATQLAPSGALPHVIPHPTADPTTFDGSPLPSSRSRLGWLLGLGALALVAIGVFTVVSNDTAAPTDAASSPESPAAEVKDVTSAAPSTEAVPSASAVPPAAVPPAAVLPAAPACPEGMALIAAGQYFQGSDAKDAADNQKPAHNVSLDAFCIDLHEVTAAAYKACSDVGRCKRPSNENTWPGIKPKEVKLYSQLCTFGVADQENYPINCVSWQMADIFCKAQDKRLPTEAEWEYAARGPDGRTYPWGDEDPTAGHLNACGNECVAWGRQHGVTLGALYDADDGHPTLAPVGSYPAGSSRFGPHDVVGNVWEWVSDWYGDYDGESKTNPTGPESGERKVIRGGGWNGSFPQWLHPSFRYAQDPTATSHGIGFRCARSARL